MKHHYPLMGLLLTALLTSCAQLDPERSRQLVTEEVRQRLDLESFPGQDLTEQVQQQLLRDWLAEPIDLQTAVRIALLQSPRVRSALLQLDLAEARRVQAGLISNPVLELEWRDQHGPNVREASISQELLDLVFLPRRRELASLAQVAAERRMAESLVLTASGVQLAWVAAVAAEQRLHLAHELGTMGQSLAELTRTLDEAGNLTMAERSRLQRRAAALQLAVGNAASQLASRREQLQAAMGLWDGDVQWSLPDRLPRLPGTEAELDQLEQEAVEASLMLAHSRQLALSEAVRLGIEDRSGWLQHLEGGWKIEREEDEWLHGPVLALSIPLFDTGRATRAGNRTRLALLEQDYRASELELRAQARAAIRQLQMSWQETSDWIDHLLPAQQAARDADWRDYNAMQLDLVDLLETEVAWIQSRLEFSRVLENYWRIHLQTSRLLAGAAPADWIGGSRGEFTSLASDNIAGAH